MKQTAAAKQQAPLKDELPQRHRSLFAVEFAPIAS
jgi:hypothetical protein